MDQQTETLQSRRKIGYYHVNRISCEPTNYTRTQQDVFKQEPVLLDKLYNIATSLPVLTSMIAFLISQGIGLNGAFWYINYLALTTIVLTVCALMISQISTFASHSFCETVFLSMYTPLSVILDMNANLLEEDTTNEPAPKMSIPSWLIHGSLIACMVADTTEFNLHSVAYVVTISSTYQIIANQMSRVGNQNGDSVSRSHIYALLSTFVIFVDVYVSPARGVVNAASFLFLNCSVRDIGKMFVQKLGLEYLEGLEVYYVDGLFELALMIVTTFVTFNHFCFSPSLFCSVYLSFYTPVYKFKNSYRCIKSESLCLNNFKLATAAQIRDYDNVCAICLSSMHWARITPCHHIFHGKCLKDCLQKKAQCPMCNTQIL